MACNQTCIPFHERGIRETTYCSYIFSIMESSIPLLKGITFEQLENYCRDSSRVVFKVGEFIFKANFEDMAEPEWRQVTNEIQRWKLIEKKDKKFFVPILDSGRIPCPACGAVVSWLQMPFITSQPRISIPKKQVIRFREVLRKYSLYDSETEGNVLVDTNKRIKICDYGCGTPDYNQFREKARFVTH